MHDLSVGSFLQQYKNPFSAVTVGLDDTIIEVVAKMIECGEERIVFVLDGEARLCGIISLGDIARHSFHEGVSPHKGYTPASSILHYLTAEHAKDIMETKTLTCMPEDSLKAVYEKMLSQAHTIKEIAVVDENDRLLDVLNLISIIGFYLGGRVEN